MDLEGHIKYDKYWREENNEKQEVYSDVEIFVYCIEEGSFFKVERV